MDSPVWAALTSQQAALAIGDERALRFPEDMSPFAACVDAVPDSVVALRDLIPEGGHIAVMQKEQVQAGDGVAVTFSARGVQMVAEHVRASGSEDRIEQLGESDAGEMFALATMTRPGPFLTNTHRMGRFIGIRDDGRLVAMAGERLRPEGFCEISAVCTHPEYRGRGFGGLLLAAVGARLLDEGVAPFLHAYADNEVAIALYRKLGFELRCEVIQEFWERAVD